MNWIRNAQDKDPFSAFVYVVMNFHGTQKLGIH